MTEERAELTPQELEQQEARDLPDREEMSMIRPIEPMPPVIFPVEPRVAE